MLLQPAAFFFWQFSVFRSGVLVVFYWVPEGFGRSVWPSASEVGQAALLVIGFIGRIAQYSWPSLGSKYRRTTVLYHSPHQQNDRKVWWGGTAFQLFYCSMLFCSLAYPDLEGSKSLNIWKWIGGCMATFLANYAPSLEKQPINKKIKRWCAKIYQQFQQEEPNLLRQTTF